MLRYVYCDRPGLALSHPGCATDDLVQFHDGLYGMGTRVHDRGYEKANRGASALGRRAQPIGGRAALGRCRLRRCQILLASARGAWPPQIAQAVGAGDQSVRTVIRRFERDGVDACLTRTRPRPSRSQTTLAAAGAERLRELLHHSPREFGQPTSVWTLDRAAAVSFAQGITRERVSDETIRRALGRLGVGWKRAKHWITSPDPAYERKKGDATA